MFKWIKSLFVKEQPAPPPTPEERFLTATDEFNEAWQAYEEDVEGTRFSDRLSPWIEWDERAIVLGYRKFARVKK